MKNTLVPTCAALLLLPAAWAEAGPVKTVRVDCSKPNASIAKALEHNADQLVVEIRGVCNEQLSIRRSGVVLRGADPAFDGIAGSGDPETAVILVQGANIARDILISATNDYAVALENLTISGGGGGGLFASDSQVKAINCRFQDNAGFGARVTLGSFAFFGSTSFARNGSTGLASSRASLSYCEGCTFEDNTGFAVSADANGQTFATSCTIVGPRGASAANGGRVDGDCPLTASVRALQAQGTGRLYWYRSNVSGSVFAAQKALLYLEDVVQTASTAANRIGDDSTLQMLGGALVGTTRIDLFGNAQFQEGSAPVSLGVLACSNGGNAFCDATVTKASSTCGLCP